MNTGYQNKGIGSVLVTRGLEACRESGYHQILYLVILTFTLDSDSPLPKLLE
ncbi:GNAT family N-acetyltransferase [Bacillus sp. JJ1609]|uniref:GNAT family N-acetyltransferase n=1 Tax=Bacillus sp. JJ1609 TaxID=3122977 RepID=UPI003F68A564